MLNTRNDWTDWYNSIKDLAIRNDVWPICDPAEVESLVFTATKPPDSATQETLQKYQSLLAIYQNIKKQYDKVSDRIDITVCQQFKQHYIGKYTVREKLIALAGSIQPSAKDQQREVRTEFEKLKKGPGNTSLDQWLGRWPALVNNVKIHKIENLNESQICDAFIEACREINPPFYNYMKSKEAQVENETALKQETARMFETISDAVINALNEIHPTHASNGNSTAHSSSVVNVDDNEDITIIQRARDMIATALSSFRGVNPVLSDQNITIGFCTRQFRSMAPSNEKTTRSRAAHATFQGSKHDRNTDSSDDEDYRPKRRKQRDESTPTVTNSPTTLRDCVCGLAHKYADCPHLNPSCATPGWTPTPQLQSKVRQTIKGSKRIRSKVESNFKRSKISLPEWWPTDRSKNQPRKENEGDNANNTATQTSVTTRLRASFATLRFTCGTTAQDNYDDYFRLDNCADTHVCNDLSRFIKYKPLHDEIIRFGDTDTHIEGIGKVVVHVETPTGPSTIQLEDVAFVPGFHWNLVNTDSLEKQGLFFNTRTCWMEYSDGLNAFKVTKHGAFRVIEPHIKHAVIEANSHTKAAQAFAMAKKSRTPQIATASMDVWHARLGHIGKNALKHVPQAVEGVALGTQDFQRTSDLCPECQLAQAHQQVSRIPTWRGSYPFEKVHLDLIHMEEAFNLDA